MTLTIPILTSLLTVAALWWLLTRDKLDWLRGLLLQVITALFAVALVVVVIFLARESLAPSYPPAPEHPGTDESGAISVGNEARDRD